MGEKPPGDYSFAGFDSPRYTPTPDQLFDELLAPGLLTEAELRVLLYIVRRTFGWKKDYDDISLSQITGGISRRDGTRLDWGAGVSKSTAVRAIKGLVSKGIIVNQRNFREDGGSAVTTFALKMRDTADDTERPTAETKRPAKALPGTNGGTKPFQNGTGSTVKPPVFYSETGEGSTVEHGGFHRDNGGSTRAKQALVPQQDTQEESNQETVKQQMDDSNHRSLQKKSGSTKGKESEQGPYSIYIAGVVSDFSDELGDGAHSVSNVSQALRLWQSFGLEEEDFVGLMYEAKRRTRSSQGRQGVRGIENKMGYFFIVLRGLLIEGHKD